MSRQKHPLGHDQLAVIAKDVATKLGFVVDFTKEELDSLRTDPTDTRGVVDMTGLLWSSIDNRESTDLDQVEVAERLADGAIRVLVGIADVDAYVPDGCPLDRHAGWNTTSLYGGVATFPMLPDELSSGESSLLPDVERLAVVTEIVVAKDGSVSDKDTKIHRARLVNKAKLVYEDVGGWLESGKGMADLSAELADQLRMQDEAAQRLRSHRIANGALELETIEPRAKAKDGEVVALEVIHKSRARELIEDLMIAINGATARYLEALRFASLRRVVRTPRRWDRIVDVAASKGARLPENPDAVALSEFLREQRAADPEHFADLSLAVVKMLGAGEYAVADPESPEGHFGLAVDDYAHSTAPNRRYGDLVTQRLLKAAARGEKPPYLAADLRSVCTRITDRENDARKFERTMRKVAAASFLSSRIGDVFDGIVTGAADKGTFVRLLDPPAEGRIVSGEQGLDVGDSVRVRLVATEPSRGFIDFARVK
jgi:exoribonuclease-2